MTDRLPNSKRNQLSLLIIGLSVGIVVFAIYRFGVVYIHSEGLTADSKGDHQTARSFWKVSAVFGYTPSKATLGSLYLTGKGGGVDPVMAQKYLLSASEDGDPDAQSLYGMALYVGATLPIDRKQGIYWLRKAADQGDSEASMFLRVIGESK